MEATMKLAFQPMGDRFSPLFFLSSLGAGGLSISFFMYLLWMTPRYGQPIPSFASLVAAFQEGGIAMQAMIAVVLVAILYFAATHLRLLVLNLRQYRAWRRTDGYAAFVRTNAESQLMAIPLTLAMAVNVLFIIGAVFVPGLWEIAEYLFPMAILAFASIGAYALYIFLNFFSRVLTEGGFNCAKNNSLGQMLSVFAFAMIGVGFSASAAMSHDPVVSAVAFMGAALFVVAAIVLGVIMLVLGFRAMMEFKADKETTPTLWIVIPFVTVVGIAIYRLNMTLMHNFGVDWAPGSIFAFLTFMLAVQLVFGMLGYAVMKRFGYFEHYVTGEGRSPGSYALICPGVALFVFANFFINPGLVGVGLVTKFSIAYFALYVPLVFLQLKTIQVYWRLNAKLLRAEQGDPVKLVPAE
jgi:hypothetical protein